MTKHEIAVTDVTPKIKLEASQICDMNVFLSTIGGYIKQNENPNNAEHINLVMFSTTLDKCGQYYKDLIVVQNTIKSLYGTPVLLSAFLNGLETTYPILYNAIKLSGAFNVDVINNALNEYLLVN